MKVFRSKKLWHSMLLVSCILSALISSAHAQNNPYPQKPVKVVVAFTAGGTTDILARIVAQQRAKQLQADIEKKRKEKEGAAETIYQLLKEIEREKSRKGA